MKTYLFSLFLALLAACNDRAQSGEMDSPKEKKEMKGAVAKKGKLHYEGVVSNGMKGDKISFDISEDGKRLENLTFTGYWRCSGRLEQIIAGPEGSYEVKDNKASGHISMPPDGGSTAWRFDIDATIEGNKASGTFRMNINNLGCDTYKLKWVAEVRD